MLQIFTRSPFFTSIWVLYNKIIWHTLSTSVVICLEIDFWFSKKSCQRLAFVVICSHDFDSIKKHKSILRFHNFELHMIPRPVNNKIMCISHCHVALFNVRHHTKQINISVVGEERTINWPQKRSSPFFSWHPIEYVK